MPNLDNRFLDYVPEEAGNDWNDWNDWGVKWWSFHDYPLVMTNIAIENGNL